MKPIERLYEHPACAIYYNVDLNLVQTVWKGIEVSSDDFRRILNQIIKALIYSTANVVLADARRMPPISETDQEWILDDWYPRAVKAGFRYQGLVLAKNSYNEIAVKELSQQYDKWVVSTHYFTTINEALGWIKELKTVGE